MKELFMKIIEWIKETKHWFSTWIFLYVTWLFFRVYSPQSLPNTLLVKILDEMAVVSIFLSMFLFGIFIIKNREGPFIIFTVKGVYSIILGILITISNLLIIIWYLRGLIMTNFY